MSSGVGAGVDASTVLDGVGTATFVFSGVRVGFRCAFISSNLGLTTKKNKPAKAPPPSKRNINTPAMIHGNFDFFFATGGSNGADGATATAACGTAISPVAARGDSAAGVGGAGGGVTGGGGGGGGGATDCGGGAGGGVAGFEISEVLGFVGVGPVVGPVLRGSATVAG